MPTILRDPWILSALGILLVGFGFQLELLHDNWHAGGHIWQQGDWLISLASGPVRRGAFGELLLTLSDALKVSPLFMVIAIQTALVTFVFFGFARLLLRQQRSVMALVVFSPGFFAILWGIDPSSSLRKELIGLAALVWLAQPGGGMARLILTGLLMLIGGLGHEIIILLLPAWLVLLWLLHAPLLRRRYTWFFIALLFFLATIELHYAIRHIGIADAAPVCEALTQRGLSENALCRGAITWLADPQNGTAKVWAALNRSWTSWLLPLAWIAATGPLWRIWNTSLPLRPGSAWLILAALAPICLLYPVGLDWGRWFAVQFAICAIILLGLGQRGLLQEVGTIRPAERTAWLVSSLSWGFLHDPVVTTYSFLARLLG